MRRALGLASIAIALGLLPATPASGAEGTEIASAFDDDNPYDIFFTVLYQYEARRAQIKREGTGRVTTTPDSPIPIVRDMLYKQNRHILTPRAQVGVFHDLELSLALPIILSDSRTFSFDQSADPCIFTGMDATCVNKENSTTLANSIGDGYLPLTGTSMGFDADNPTVGFNPATDTTVFKGINRSGLDQLHFGLAWAPIAQKRDDTKPTWVIGIEYRYSIGKMMKFDRMDPGGQAGVSPGVDQFKAYTSLSKRTTWSEPYVTFWWLAPTRYRGQTPEDPNGTLFWDLGYGQENPGMQQQAGTTFGFEAIPWENPVQKQKIAIQFQGRLEAHFEGRGYSEMWEVYSYAGDKRFPGGPLILDSNPVMMGQQAMSHPGVGMIENYMTWGGRLGVRGDVGAHAHFDMSFEIAGDQKHRISWDDAGEDGPDPDDIITPNTDEGNPLYVRSLDLTGRRYVVDNTAIYTFFVSGQVLF